MFITISAHLSNVCHDIPDDTNFFFGLTNANWPPIIIKMFANKLDKLVISIGRDYGLRFLNRENFDLLSEVSIFVPLLHIYKADFKPVWFLLDSAHFCYLNKPKNSKRYHERTSKWTAGSSMLVPL